MPAKFREKVAQAALTKRDYIVGGTVAVFVHLFFGLAMALAPTEKAAIDTQAADKQGCSSVVSPNCLGTAQLKKSALSKDDKEIMAEDRRCPEPMRRLMRRDLEPPKSVAVDLLQAQVVANLGVETGIMRQDIADHAGAGEQVAKAVPKPTDGLFGESKLGQIMAEDKGGGEAKKKKLGDIIGTATGQKNGDGKVNISGSAWGREVRLAVQRKFVLPASVPIWEQDGLVAKVRITRMSATGQVMEFAIEKKSGNDDFDATVRTLMLGYKSGMHQLPMPSAEIVEQVNSRGMTVELRGHSAN